MRRLSVRLLIFNILLIFLPLGSLLYLDTYEKQLLANQEQSMIQQARIFSAALRGENLQEEAETILLKLKSRVDSRIRILDTGGNLLADTAVTESDLESAGMDGDWYMEGGNRNASLTLLYRIMILPVRMFKSILSPPGAGYGTGEYYSGKKVLFGEEIQAALDGRYGAATRISSGGQVSGESLFRHTRMGLT